MKRAFIFHGWDGTPTGSFKPWLKSKLEELGYEVVVPVLPHAKTPRKEEWLQTIQHVVGIPDEETVLVGHSLGGLAVLLYLSSLPDSARCKKVILVAPVVDAILDMTEEEKAVAKPWLEASIDPEKVRRFSSVITGFFSDNDGAIPTRSEQVLKETYGAKTFMLHDRGHFDDSAGIKEVPEVLQEILS